MNRRLRGVYTGQLKRSEILVRILCSTFLTIVGLVIKKIIARYIASASKGISYSLDKLVVATHPAAVIKQYNGIVKELEAQSFTIPLLDNKTLFDEEFYTLLLKRRKELIDNGTLVAYENEGGFAVKYKVEGDIRKMMDELKTALLVRCVIHHRSKNGSEPLQDPWGVE
jgi:hypothetical protein